MPFGRGTVVDSRQCFGMRRGDGIVHHNVTHVENVTTAMLRNWPQCVDKTVLELSRSAKAAVSSSSVSLWSFIVFKMGCVEEGVDVVARDAFVASTTHPAWLLQGRVNVVARAVLVAALR